MPVRAEKTFVKNTAEPSASARTVHVRDSILSQLRQMGMNVEDDELLTELDCFNEEELVAVLGLFGLLGYFALLGLLASRDTQS